MKSRSLQEATDIQVVRALMERAPCESTVSDPEEVMQLPQVRANTRLWWDGGRAVGFVFVDPFCNLNFELDPPYRTGQLEDEIVEWGIACVKKDNAEAETPLSLDACLNASDAWRIAMLERHGFVRTDIRSLHYSRSLSGPIREQPLPPGFSLRCAAGEAEVEALVELHRAAFGTLNMTVEERLAIMRAPGYERELDLLAVSPDGELAAFCICSLEGLVGYTDPIGVRPRYHRMRLGKAIVTAGMKMLQGRGAQSVELGTSSENLAMQGLAESLGFEVVSERLWFSKTIT